jgi:hypothetical protein
MRSQSAFFYWKTWAEPISAKTNSRMTVGGVTLWENQSLVHKIQRACAVTRLRAKFVTLTENGNRNFTFSDHSVMSWILFSLEWLFQAIFYECHKTALLASKISLKQHFCISWQDILKSDRNPADSEKTWIVRASAAGNHLFEVSDDIFIL